jgi:hypothetical protein
MIQPTKKQRPRNKRFSPLHCGSKEQLVAVPLQTDRDHCPLRATNNKGDVPKPPTGNPGGSSQALQLGCVGKRAIFSSALVCERRHLHSGRHICRGVWAFSRNPALIERRCHTMTDSVSRPEVFGRRQRRAIHTLRRPAFENLGRPRSFGPSLPFHERSRSKRGTLCVR